MKTLEIPAIKEGTVIDHILTKNTFKVIELMKLRDINDIVTVGMNFNSKKLEKKSLIKISDRFLTKQEIDKIALIAPEANINIIKDYN